MKYGTGGRHMILEIRLINVKSHKDTTLKFTSGVNAILGDNGAGKTTVIEAIGFALFDFLPYKKMVEFLRRGENRGEVRVKILGADGRIYRIVRKFEKNKTVLYYVEDIELGRVAEGRDEVLEWVRENFGLESDLRTVFENIIGVRQGMMISHFLSPPTVREAIFSPVIGVESYRKAFEKSKEYENYLRDKSEKIKGEITELRKDVEKFKEKKDDLIRLQKMKNQLNSRLKEKKRELEIIEKEVEELKNLREEVQMLKLQLSDEKGEENRLREDVSRLEKELEKVKEAENRMKEIEPAFRESEELEKKLDKLENFKKKVEDEYLKLVKKDEKLRSLLERVEELRLKVKDVEELRKEVEKLRSLAEREENLREEINRIVLAETILKDIEGRIKSLNIEIKEKSKKIEDSKRRLDELKVLSVKLEKLRQLEEKREEAIKKKSYLETRLKIEKRTLEEMLNGVCPILKEECRRIVEAGEVKREEIDELSKKFGALNSIIEKLDRALRIKREIEEKISALKAEKELLREMQEVIDKKKEELKELKSEAESLKKVVVLGKKLKDEFKKVSGSTEKLSKISERLRQKESLLEEIKFIEKKISNLKDEVKTLPDVRGKLEEIEEKIDSIKARLKELKPIVNEYHSITSIVSKKEKINFELENARKKLREIEEKVKETGKRLEELRKRYSEEKFENLSKNAKEIRNEYSIIQGRVGELNRRIEELEKDVEKLPELENKLKERTAEIEKIEKKYKFVKDLREIFKKAAPSIVKAYTDAVSVEANRIFCELMDDYTWELRWCEDYSIKAVYRGREIEFTQMSGGEQMCAAIAVRLALLKVLSSASIAFFDEPTQNMDEVRRKNLASQISKIEGFRQIFVITHDDSFEEVVENAVKLIRDEGVTVVES
jgi:exonuclease SbcC